MKIVAGLGNPGMEYLNTRHNAGWMVLDMFLARNGLAWGRQRRGYFALRACVGGVKVVFVKPARYMNLSGGPVREVMEELGAGPEDLLVLHDDIDIPKGEARYKFDGGHAGHNGVKSIISELGARRFHRIRIGVGRPPEGMNPADYVLSGLEDAEEEEFLASADQAMELVQSRFLEPAI